MEDNMNSYIPAAGTKVYAHIVRPGFIVEANSKRIDVQDVVEDYDTLTLDNGHGRKARVGYGDLVTVLGYFNP